MNIQLHPETNGELRKTRKNNYKGKPIIETLTNGYFIVDHEWTVKYWNKAAEKLLGVAEKDILGKNLWKRFANLIPIEFYAVYNKAFLEDIPIHFHEYWAEMDTWFDVTTLYSEDALCVSFKSSSHPHSKNSDSTLERLNTLTELYKFVTEITNDCLWEWDLGSNEIFWVDGGHKRVFGYPIENKLIPANFWKRCIHPDDKERVLSSLNKTINDASECTWEDEYRFKRADGEYCYVCDRGHIVRDENDNATRIIGATQDITKRVLLEKQLAAQKAEQQREVTSSVLTALENERGRIGMEIHDNLAQVMAVTKLYMQMVKKSEVNRELNINKSIGFIQDVMDAIRKLSKALIIPPSHIIGLLNNIRILLADVMAVHPIKIELRNSGIIEKGLSSELQINIFRIIQEQINNILKHSDASHASISLNRYNNEILLTIADNGKGHDPLQEKKGVGIINIKTRVELFQGTLMIDSEPGKGYELKATFLLPKE